jgi:hypothetical protein
MLIAGLGLKVASALCGRRQNVKAYIECHSMLRSSRRQLRIRSLIQPARSP